MEPKSNKKWWIIGGVVVVALIAFMIINGMKSNGPVSIVAGDQNALVIADQDPNAVAVLVSSVSTREPAFIVIHDDLNGRPGAIVGVSNLLQPGSYNNTTVIMNLKPGATYYGMLHADDGNGIFAADTDARHLNDNTGMEVMTSFKVRLSSTPGDYKG